MTFFYDIKDKSEFLRIKGLLIGRANALGFGPDYKDYLGQLEIEIDEYNDAEEYNHQTAFGINNWPKLNCGKWIADKKGVRKKNAKIISEKPIFFCNLPYIFLPPYKLHYNLSLLLALVLL